MVWEETCLCSLPSTSGVTRVEKQLFLLYLALVSLVLVSHLPVRLCRTLFSPEPGSVTHFKKKKKTLAGCRALAAPKLLLQALVVHPF